MDAATKDWRGIFKPCALAVVALTIVGCAPIDTLDDVDASPTDPLQEAERRILETTDGSYENGDTSRAYALKREMLEWDIAPTKLAEFDYWLSFLDFNLARLEEHFGDPDQSLRLLNHALEQLNSTDGSHAEAQALNAILVKSKIPLTPDDTFELLMSMRETLDTALSLDQSSLRVQLAAVMDVVIHVPGFGRASNPDEIIAVALATDPEGQKSSILSHPPTWGRAEVFALKVIHLRNSGLNDEAELTLEMALREYPSHFRLKMLDAQ
ncbi:MAG: hypothetical protein OXG24_06910 [Gammaproteobacteria bacterium]|nr:hypothetical protein [Gammaproteobacteria bacterium]